MQHFDGAEDQSVSRLHARQRQRLADYEERLRKDLALDERAERFGSLQTACERWRASSAAIMSTEREGARRNVLISAQELERNALADLRRRTAVATVVLPMEITQRKAYSASEAVARQRLDLALRGRSALLAVAEVEQEEARWREALLKQVDIEGTPIWTAAVAERLRFLVEPVGTHSEVFYRRFLVLTEHRERTGLAVHFCMLRVLWLESWARVSLQLGIRLFYQHLRAAGEVSREEALAREELRLLYTPLAVDIREELEDRQERTARRERKLDALRALRRAEVDRLVTKRELGDVEVDKWRATELDRIAEAHAQMLAGLVAYAADAADGAESATAALRAAGSLDARLERLSSPQVPFREIVAYRKSLLGFDSFVSTVESVLGTPDTLRSHPMMLTDAPVTPDTRRIAWSSARRLRYRTETRREAEYAQLNGQNSPFRLMCYDTVQRAADRRDAGGTTRAIEWPNSREATAAERGGAALVLVPDDEESAQRRIAAEIRASLVRERGAAAAETRPEYAGSMALVPVGPQDDFIPVQLLPGKSSGNASGHEGAALEALRRRMDHAEAAEMERHAAALDALHMHLRSFI
jgi:hypothetical protein